MALSTTPFIPGREIEKSLGVVCGEAILGANVVSDLLAGITDIVGGRSGSYEGKLKAAREIALVELAVEARERGANAVVGIDIDYETLRGSMLMVAASGTAVVAKQT
ncbi:MAG TPA: YbjQ family protein [Kiritimatiellia bacterium]|nr:YbjQ family protein [Kiritimatiellia bacterium]HRZ12665.1 YbjQ family protein [Kiritimatiellia bacterium]HSA19567.1 YbjQ family protein [Kiritimatiellia bacterium]